MATVATALLLCGCAAVPRPSARPLAYVIREKPLVETPVSCGGCWMKMSAVESSGYLLFFSPTRTAPNLTEYLFQLEAGSGSRVLRNADVCVGSQLNVPVLFLFGAHSWADLAFANGGL